MTGKRPRTVFILLLSVATAACASTSREDRAVEAVYATACSRIRRDAKIRLSREFVIEVIPNKVNFKPLRPEQKEFERKLAQRIAEELIRALDLARTLRNWRRLFYGEEFQKSENDDSVILDARWQIWCIKYPTERHFGDYPRSVLDEEIEDLTFHDDDDYEVLESWSSGIDSALRILKVRMLSDSAIERSESNSTGKRDTGLK